MEKWIACGVNDEGAPIDVEGVNPWGFDWIDQRQTVTLPHPSYPHQHHAFRVFAINVYGKRITFAACEVSANAWGFYVPAATSATL